MSKELHKRIEQIYINNRDSLVKHFTHRCDGSEMDGEDIVQEGFTRALTYIDSAPEGSDKDLENWMFKICQNCFKDNRRDNRLGGAVDIDEFEEIVDFDPQDESMRYARQLLKCSDKLNESMDEGTRRGIHLHFFNGYRCTDLSRLIGNSPKFWERRIQSTRDKILDLAKRQGYYSGGRWVPVME